MAKNDQEESFERLLTTTLARVVEFLKFAEAKNAALLTFASAWLLASANLLFIAKQMPSLVWYSIVCSEPFLLIAAVTAMLSFLPRTKLFKFYRDPEQRKSLIYFGDISTFDAASYRERVYERYMPDNKSSVTRSYTDDLIIQIYANSKIASRKFTMFNFGGYLLFAALLVIVAPFTLSWVHNHMSIL